MLTYPGAGTSMAGSCQRRMTHQGWRSLALQRNLVHPGAVTKLASYSSARTVIRTGNTCTELLRAQGLG